MREQSEQHITVHQKTSRERWGVVLMIPLLIGVVALFVLSFAWKDSLKIQRIIVDGAHSLSAKDIYTLANVPSKTQMYRVNLLEVQKRLMNQPYIKSATVHLRFPDALEIDIVEREPIASLNQGQLNYIDKEGVLLPYTDTQKKLDLPVICGIDGMQNATQISEISNKELLAAIEICQTAQSIDSTVYHMISEINMNNGNDIILYSADAGVPIFVGRGRIAQKLVTLENFWKQFVATSDVEKIRYIDLRYDDQVVVKWNQQQDQQSKKISL